MSWMETLAMFMPVIGAIALGLFGLYISRNDGKTRREGRGPAE